jgi:osmotically-inducible protein OsmY
MKTDLQIQKDVMEELNWEPSLNASEIGVAVRNSVVTLSGKVDTFSKKLTAEKAAKRVAGVKAVAEEIHVGIPMGFAKTDAEIAEAVLIALQWHTSVQEEKVKIKVEEGNVTLEGEVEWEYQRASAKTAIEQLAGIRSITNLIIVKPQITALDIRQKISSAFHRSANIDAGRIDVNVNDTKVILSGKVRSLAEKEDAETAAWAAPGITSVENNLEVVVKEYILAK